MLKVSFGSLFVLPKTGSLNTSRREFINRTHPLVKRENCYVNCNYDAKKDAYYVNINDKDDRTFLRCASIYGIKVKKAKNSDLKDTIKLNAEKTPAELDMEDLIKSIAWGYKNSIKNDGNGKKTVSVTYQIPGNARTSEIVYDLDMNKEPKLVKKVYYSNGEPREISEYDEKGYFTEEF